MAGLPSTGIRPGQQICPANLARSSLTAGRFFCVPTLIVVALISSFLASMRQVGCGLKVVHAEWLRHDKQGRLMVPGALDARTESVVGAAQNIFLAHHRFYIRVGNAEQVGNTNCLESTKVG